MTLAKDATVVNGQACCWLVNWQEDHLGADAFFYCSVLARLLLDTHVVLGWLADDPGLPEEIKDRLDHEPDVRVSAATIWEIAIKRALGKISAPADLPRESATADSGSFRSISPTRWPPGAFR